MLYEISLPAEFGFLSFAVPARSIYVNVEIRCQYLLFMLYGTWNSSILLSHSIELKGDLLTSLTLRKRKIAKAVLLWRLVRLRRQSLVFRQSYSVGVSGEVVRFESPVTGPRNKGVGREGGGGWSALCVGRTATPAIVPTQEFL